MQKYEPHSSSVLGAMAKCPPWLAIAPARPSEILNAYNTGAGSYLASMCLSQVARSISVHGYGYLTLALKDVPGLRDFYSGFSFQTSQREGLLYHHSTQVGTHSPPQLSW